VGLSTKNDVMSQYLVPAFIIVLLLIFFIASQLKFEKKKMMLQIRGKQIALTVEIADNSFKRSLGLMFRGSLESNEGMLFIFNDERQRSFWMLNTKIPLDAIFFDSSGKVVDIIQMEPCKSLHCAAYTSEKPAKYVLEVNKNFSQQYNISTSTIFKLS